ncbi:MAG: cytochrome c-type biogenesis protein CcmH [Nannocystaceae bacterium]|nr:cytochrome c-type biogenesis protein CcmH [Nannocystaceae bacterium]
MFEPAKKPADREAEQLLSTLSADLMSPFCPGRTIASCPSSQARKLEERILAEAKSGKTRDQIEQSLVADYGSDIIGYKPPPSLMITTVVGGTLALSLILVLGRRWVRRAKPEGVATAGSGSSPTGGPSLAEMDALEDALDDEEAF